jgi:hypothetical protein
VVTYPNDAAVVVRLRVQLVLMLVLMMVLVVVMVMVLLRLWLVGRRLVVGVVGALDHLHLLHQQAHTRT